MRNKFLSETASHETFREQLKGVCALQYFNQNFGISRVVLAKVCNAAPQAKAPTKQSRGWCSMMTTMVEVSTDALSFAAIS